MSTQNTKYEISTGQDLSSIFAPRLITDPSNAVTGFEYFDTTSSSYQDLSNLFLPYSTGVISATNYVSNLLPYGGKDLNIILNQLQKGCSEYIDCNTSKKKRNEIVNRY